MRHALVVTQLFHEARSAPEAAERQLADAPPDPEPPRGPGSPTAGKRSHRSRWLTSRRAVLRLRT
jgi:hypothetical protein